MRREEPESFRRRKSGLGFGLQARARWQVGKMKHMKHYTADDIEMSIEDERAKFVIWRCEALRELRACLLATQDGQRPKRQRERP